MSSKKTNARRGARMGRAIAEALEARRLLAAPLVIGQDSGFDVQGLTIHFDQGVNLDYAAVNVTNLTAGTPVIHSGNLAGDADWLRYAFDFMDPPGWQYGV